MNRELRKLNESWRNLLGNLKYIEKRYKSRISICMWMISSNSPMKSWIIWIFFHWFMIHDVFVSQKKIEISEFHGCSWKLETCVQCHQPNNYCVNYWHNMTNDEIILRWLFHPDEDVFIHWLIVSFRMLNENMLCLSCRVKQEHCRISQVFQVQIACCSK